MEPRAFQLNAHQNDSMRWTKWTQTAGGTSIQFAVYLWKRKAYIKRYPLIQYYTLICSLAINILFPFFYFSY